MQEAKVKCILNVHQNGKTTPPKWGAETPKPGIFSERPAEMLINAENQSGNYIQGSASRATPPGAGIIAHT
ncbi:hypothetical protein B0A49_00415 [Cryomyces minteri]|uniref:Uncharacterized protein n=1 Tax=Cryomyces minteri TaxID=331657 RepID=A0A4U0XWS8_9PEZI|nr:hypothetical protein B0A49_00415 [Cryomyces minteri]